MSSGSGKNKNNNNNKSNHDMIDLTTMIQDELWTDHILPFVGFGNYAVVAPVSRKFYKLYGVFCHKIPTAARPKCYSVFGRRGFVETRTMEFYDTFDSVVLASESNIQYYKSNYPDWFFDHARLLAARDGKLDLLKQWAENANNIHCRPADEYDCALAAKYGQFETLKWLRQPPQNCPWNWLTTRLSATGGHLEILQWAIDNQCPAERKLVYFAACCGRLNVLDWCRRNRYDLNIYNVTVPAAGFGKLEVLEFASEHGLLPRDNWEFIFAAALKGRLDSIMFLRGKGCHWDEGTIRAAANEGREPRLEIVRFALENGCPFDLDTVANLVAREYSCPKDIEHCAAIVRWLELNGHGHVL